jgi:endonuclease YncB( thermonuclease family)
VADPYAAFEQGPPALQALTNLQNMGAVVTNGRRTDADYFRLKAEGYTPARYGAHPQGDGVDLVPGGKFQSLAALQAEAQRQFGPNAVVQIHNGTHVHVATPDFQGMAPDVTRGPDSYAGFEQVAGPAAASPKAQLNASTALTPVARPPVTLTGANHDGDTVALTSGRNGRLFGADAFELNQTGRDASGNLVPLGIQGRDFMASQIAPGMFANPTGASTYGRPVITLSQDPMNDPAQRLLRSGLGMAEPQYLQGSPQFGPYMEAERLARLNRLGGFATNAETPSQFRHGNGPWAGAQPGVYGQNADVTFFDEPTPFQGLRPDIAKGYLDLSRTGSADDLVNYAKANGFQISPKDAAAFVAKRDKGAHVDYKISYQQLPRPVIDPGDKTFGSFARGIGDPFNALDELGAIPDSLGLTPGRMNIFNAPPGTRFGDVFNLNLDQNRAILEHDQEAHPYARLGGQLTSGLLLPAFSASTPARLAAVMGTEGGLAGLMGGEGSIAQRFPQAAAGAVLGTAGGLGLGLAGQHVVGPLWRRFVGNRAATAADDTASAAAAGMPAGAAPVAPQSPGMAAMAADRGPSIVSPVVPREPDYLNIRTGVDPYAGFQRVTPSDVSGISAASVLTPADNSVSSLDEALLANPSRFQDMALPNETNVLPKLTMRSGNDLFRTSTRRDVYDVTKFLRANGGVQDAPGGELAKLGITNAPRPDLPFGRNEQFLGKLINPEGMTLDEAGQALQQAGYFHERPTVGDLIDVLHGEQNGNSVYHPDDLATVDEFHRLQAQRYAMQDAAAEGRPFAEDASQPVSLDDMLKRTAPDYAYSEVPTAKIGNLNISKIEGSDDLARLMQHIEASLGDHPLQAKVTNEQTKGAAADLGMSVKDFLQAHPGQLDAKGIVAGRVLLHSALEATRRAALKVVSGTATDADKLAFEHAKLVTAAIQDQMKAATAEAGRKLQALKIVSTGDDMRLAAARQAMRLNAGQGTIEDSARDFLDVVQDPAKANRYIAKDSNATTLQKFNEALTMARLSNPATHFRNFIGNTGALALTFPEKAIEAGISKIGTALGGPAEGQSFLSEGAARAKGMLQAMPEAFATMRSAFRTGDPVDGASKIEAQQYHAISGRKGELIRIPGRLMTAADELFKSLAHAGEVSALARRAAIKSGGSPEQRATLEAQLRHNPTEEMNTAATVEARYRTFQQELGTAGKLLQQASNTIPGAKIVLNFVRTPINLLKFAAERTPLGLAMPSVLRKLATPGQPRYEALARMASTSMALSALSVAAVNGDITGNGPSDPGQRSMLMASGWRPLSFKVGNQWVSYANYDPFSSLVATVADFAESGKYLSDKDREAQATNITLSALEHFTDNAWFNGLSDFFGAMKDHESAPGYIARTASGVVVPSIVGRASQIIDPTIRDTRINSASEPSPIMRTLEMSRDAIQSRIPFASRALPVRRDVWGQPMQRDNAIGPDALTPFQLSTIKRDPVSTEMLRLKVMPGMPQKSLSVDGNKVALSPQQYDEFVQLSRQPAKQDIAQLMASPEWRTMNDADRREAVNGILKDRRDDAIDEMLRRHPALDPSSDPYAAFQADPYAGFHPAH